MYPVVEPAGEHDHEEVIARMAALRDRYPDRFLIGTDPMSLTSASAYFWVFEMSLPVVRQLKPETESKYLRPTMNASSTKGASASASGRRRICGNYTTTTRREHEPKAKSPQSRILRIDSVVGVAIVRDDSLRGAYAIVKAPTEYGTGFHAMLREGRSCACENEKPSHSDKAFRHDPISFC